MQTRTLSVLLATLMSCLAFLWALPAFADGPNGGRTGATAPLGGGGTFFTDRAAFTANNPGLPYEEWDGNCANAIGLPSVLNSTTDNSCFDPGDVLPGIEAQAFDPACPGAFCLLYHPDVYTNTLDSWVGAFTWLHPHVLVFTPSVTAVGLDLASFYSASAMDVRFYSGDFLVGEHHFGSVGPAGAFLGFTFPDGVTRVEIASMNASSNHGYEGTYGVFFGEMAVEPTIDVSPLTFHETHSTPPQMSTDTLTIENSGSGDLNWSVTELDNVSTMGGDGCPAAVDIPWLSLSPTTGETAPGESDSVILTYNSAGLAAGDYWANVCVGSNDRENSAVTVRLTLTVSPPPTAVELTRFEGGAGPVVPQAVVAAAALMLAAAGAARRLATLSERDA